MNLVPMLVAAALPLVAGCAAAPQGSITGASAGSTGAQYCKRDRLTNQEDQLVCTWSDSIADACENTNVSRIAKSAVASGPGSAGRCGNGQWLVTVTTR